MSVTQALLDDIEKFLKATDMAATTFGHKACRDPHAVRRLRAGLGLTMKRAEQMRKFMSEYQDRKSRPKRQHQHAAA